MPLRAALVHAVQLGAVVRVPVSGGLLEELAQLGVEEPPVAVLLV